MIKLKDEHIERYLESLTQVPLLSVAALRLPLPIDVPRDADDTWHFRHNPQYHLSNAKSAIVFLYPYQLVQCLATSGEGLVASIGQHPDYHRTIQGDLTAILSLIKRDQPTVNGKVFVDKHGLDDRWMANQAGLGFYGKHNLIISPALGSTVNIGYILLDCELENSCQQSCVGQCGTCSRCIDACPNQALAEDGFNRSRCRAYVNQKKGVLSCDDIALMGNWLYGCDICQYACPYNVVVKSSVGAVNLSAIMEMTKAQFKAKYAQKSYGFLGQTRLKRNAMILLFKQAGIAALTPYLDIIKRSPLLHSQYELLQQIHHQSVGNCDIINANNTIGGYMQDIHELHYLREKIDQLKADGVYRQLPVLNGPNEAVCQLNGIEVINLSSNNYLGFANNPRIKAAAIKGVEQYGVGAGAVRTIVGNMDIHEQLEAKLAAFKREEAVMVFQSGFNCNAGAIQALTGKGDLIISDELNHASIIDGVRLSKADRAVFKHSDMADLERVLSENKGKYNTVLIITDGVFSMDGDIAKLPEIVDLAEAYGALTYVDDAHGSGVLGENGRGTVDHFGLHGRVDFSIGTLSKAIGVIGGYVAGKHVTYDWLSHRGRPLLFSTALPPAAVCAITEAIEMLSSSSEYTDKLWQNGDYFKAKLGELGYDIGHSETPITPVIIGGEAQTMEFSSKLLDNGVFASGIVFPTVPVGTGRVRCMVTASHTTAQLDQAVAVFKKVGTAMGIIK